MKRARLRPCLRPSLRPSQQPALRAALVCLAAALLPPLAWAHAPALHTFPEADLALGSRLIQQHKCSTCHAGKVGGDGSALYRPAGRVNTPAALLSMVERCSTELNLGLFPEDVASVAAVLNRDHYRFQASNPASSPAAAPARPLQR